MRANNDVVVADNGGQHTNREDDRERGKPCRNERESQHVGLACTPVPVEQRGGALPIHIARPMDSCRNKFGHRFWCNFDWAYASWQVLYVFDGEVRACKCTTT